MSGRKSIGRLRGIAQNNYIILFIVVAMGVMAAVSPFFLGITNLLGILNQIAIYGIVAFAMTYAVICGEFDLSVATTFPMSGVLFIMFVDRYGVLPSLLIALSYGLAIGCLNGVLVSLLRINSFIVTLGTMLVSNGVGMTVTRGNTLKTAHEGITAFGDWRYGSLTAFFFIFLALGLIAQFVLSSTRFGRNLYATGGNQEVARLSGINTRFYKFIIFVILGVSASLAGVLLAVRLSAHAADYGKDLAMYAVSVVIIGGASLAGGKGSIGKTFLGLFFMGVIFNGFNLIQVQSYIQAGIKGLILIFVVLLDHYSPRKRAYE
jgi:ribose transport system permease protein